MNETKTVVVNDKANSIEITQNSKGFNWNVKVYGNNPEEIKKDLSGMIDLAKETIKNLEVKE